MGSGVWAARLGREFIWGFSTSWRFGDLDPRSPPRFVTYQGMALQRLLRRLGSVRVLGLRVSRFAQWTRAVREAGRQVAYWVLIREMARGLWQGICAKRTAEAKRRRRRAYRACLRCPVFDRTRKVCQPFPGSPLGCKCYMPMKAAADGKCWGRQNVPGFPFGY